MFEDLQKVVTWFVAATSGLLLWIGKREIKRIDSLEAKVTELREKDAGFLTREEFHKTLSSWSQERRDMHSETKDTLIRIHSRVDALWARGEK